MQYIDTATADLILFAFEIIAIIFILTLVLEVIANFFRMIFNIGKKNDNFKK